MPLDLTGISNVGDFYSPHYLEVLLEKDLHPLFERWSKRTTDAGQTEETARTPDRLLSACATPYFAAKSRALRATSSRDRYTEAHQVHVEIATALGYTVGQPGYELLVEKTAVPVMCTLQRDGAPYLWIVEAPFTTEGGSPFEETIVSDQLPELADDVSACEEPWQKLPELIFARERPPRWVLLMAGRYLVLMDRTKWAMGQYLLVDLDEIYSRRTGSTIRAVAALLARESLCPDDGIILLDTLDEGSHRHAFGVSKDLTYGVRRAVELLGNEYIRYKREVAHDTVFADEQLARELTSECLTYLYRLLFIFYAEARAGELGILPMNSEEYRLGYSLESLRDLEQVPLTTDKARNGFFLHESLEQLFRLINNGHHPAQAVLVTEEALGDTARMLDTGGFVIQGLHSPLFDRGRTPRLSSVKFRNSVLQVIINLLSLSREDRRTRGRVSYATLGINQLGAVYEALLSYSGFFAAERLYEVKKAGVAANDETEQSYFVPESALYKYKDEEIVADESGEGERRRRIHERGSFIFRLAGRDRQKSASYYTPECLTQCLVKYALKELIGEEEGDENWKTADQILGLTICEPAMGSAAFLNEAVNQLAEAYLDRKQHELGRRIPPETFRDELQRVKEYIATRNCYGVDLNPTAVELGKISLWLNIIHRGMAAPWFGLRLVAGNSLIGARRQVFSAGNVARGNWLKTPKDFPEETWDQHLVPEAVSLAGPGSAPYQMPHRPEGSIYHFLLPAKGMAAFGDDRVIRDLAPDDVARIREWRKSFCRKPAKADIQVLQRLSDRVDALWERAIQERIDALAQTADDLQVWPEPAAGGRRAPSIAAKERVLNRLHSPWSAYSRLKLVMDYWCALWFWSITASELLPSWDEWLLDLQFILEGSADVVQPDQATLPGMDDADERAQLASYVNEFGFVNVNEMCERVPRLAAVRQIAAEHRFHHWELVFGDVAARAGGFDLLIGNPPWVRVRWEEAGVLSEIEPVLALRDYSAHDVARLRAEAIGKTLPEELYLAGFEEQAGSLSYLGSEQSYPLLQGQHANLYKCFITRAWEMQSGDAVSAFVHPDGPYEDPKAGRLREALYPRLRRHFQFENELQLFEGTNDHGRMRFGLHVYGSQRSNVHFDTMANVFHPRTIDVSYGHDGTGAVPGIKDDSGNWELRGHRRRVVRVGPDELRLFADLYDAVDTPCAQARLGAIHADDVIASLRAFELANRRVRDEDGGWLATELWNETSAQRDDLIERRTAWVRQIERWVLSGPHFFVASPLNKTPRARCTHNTHYDEIDLWLLDNGYLPRTNYVPGCTMERYYGRVPNFGGRKVTDYFRIAFRKQLSLSTERTLIAALVPPKVGHTNAVLSLALEDSQSVALLLALCASLPFDYYMKSVGRGNLYGEALIRLPLPTDSPFAPCLVRRALRLNCLADYHAEFWEDVSDVSMASDGWARQDERLHPWSSQITQHWSRHCAVRTDYARRQALIEIDALSALSLGLTAEQLVTIYRIQFPVLQQYERNNRYDQRGKLVPPAILREWEQRDQSDDSIEWERNLDFLPEHQRDLAHLADLPPKDRYIAGLPLTGDFDPARELWYPPFTACDRETDMRQAYGHFQALIGAQ